MISPFDAAPVFLPPDPRRSVTDLLQTIWRWRGRFSLVFGSILFIGALALFAMPIKYTAQALVMVGMREPNPLVTEPPSSSQQRELDVDGAIQVMTSALSINRVIEKLDLLNQPEFEKSAQSAKPNLLVRLRSLFGAGEPEISAATVVAEVVDRHLKVDRLGRSSLVAVKYTASQPQLATDIANAIASNTAADDAFRNNLTVTERAGFDLLRFWLVSPATVPVKPSSPNVLLVLAVAVGGGLCAALSAVLFADYYATRKVITPDQITRHGVRSLSFIPAYSGVEERAAVRMIAERPQDAFSDSIASLRASLLRLVPREPPTCLVLMFTSAVPFEGKSTTAAALATSIAASGGRVLLIDADLRSPSLHQVFGANSSAGLQNILDHNEYALDQLVQVDPDSGVSLLTAGRRSSHPVDILTSKELSRAIDDWRKSFDYILIDVPPVLATTPDALTLVPIVDYCVFVVRWGKTSWETIGLGLRMLTDTGCKIAGIAVSRVDLKRYASSGFLYPY